MRLPTDEELVEVMRLVVTDGSITVTDDEVASMITRNTWIADTNTPFDAIPQMATLFRANFHMGVLLGLEIARFNGWEK